ncbi:hypothetical protein [Aureispira anguillae]|uniref:Uncharacterized protein n=1 Tax=Aureispira anguillae TaxID=2864201 RepID=A0A915YD93_9BACT|nr:hypothetical protein [Aureispira anguillae]BDS10906.1 hypothetical protein AsAng_0016160 [Aureispira anguillae]
MKPLFIFVFYLSALNYLCAQSVSNEITIKGKNGTHYLIEENKIIRLNSNSIKIFNQENLMLIREIPLSSLPKNWIPIELIKFQEKILLFYKSTPANNKFSGYYHLYCQEIDIENEKLITSGRLITGLAQEFLSGIINEHKNVYFPRASSMFNYPYVEINISQDSSKLIVSNIGLHGLVFNPKMEPILKYAIADFSDKKNLIPISELVDNHGNYHAIAKLFEFEDEFNYSSGENFSKYEDEYNLVYLHSKVDGKTMMKEIDKLEGNQITCATLKELSNGEIVCVGAYGDNETKSGLEHGLYCFYISKMNDLVKIPFTHDEFREDDILEKENKIKALLNSINLFETEEKEILAIGERIAAPKGFNFGDYISYQDIIMVNLDKELKKKWLHRLPKNVTYGMKDYGGGSYKYSYLKGSHYLFFLDNKNNIYKDITEKPSRCQSSKNGNLVAYRIKESGRVKKIVLYENFMSTTGFQTRTIRSISDNEIIFDNCLNNNKSILIKLLL